MPAGLIRMTQRTSRRPGGAEPRQSPTKLQFVEVRSVDNGLPDLGSDKLSLSVLKDRQTALAVTA